MKNNLTFSSRAIGTSFLLFAFLANSLFSQSNINQTLSVNGTGNIADASAQLDVSAIDKGMLVPRMTSAQRIAIALPAPGLLVYDTTTGGFWVHTGSAWRALAAILVDADGDTKVQVEESPDEDIIRFDLGGTERMVLRKNAGSSSRLELPNSSDNTFIGTNAGSDNTTGTHNTANGVSALGNNTVGNHNTANGTFTLVLNTDGDNNSANGFQALFFNTTGDYNTANGSGTMYYNTTGFSNTAMGVSALVNNTTRSNLVAVGDSSLYKNGEGATLSSHATANTAIGSKSLYANTTGYQNTALGYNAMFDNTIGDGNTAGGYLALSNNTTGVANAGFGHNSLLANTTGSQNTALGKNAYFNSPNLSNTTCIGFNSGNLVNVSNRIEIGNTSVSFIGGQVNWGTYSDARIKTQVQENVPGLDFITQLRPVTYHLDIHRQNALCGLDKRDSSDWEGKYDIEQKQMTGFIAQEVEAAAKATGYDFSGVEKGADEVGMYSVKYAEFVVPLVKGMQEQQTIIEALKTDNASLKSQLDKITAALAGAGIAVEK